MFSRPGNVFGNNGITISFRKSNKLNHGQNDIVCKVKNRSETVAVTIFCVIPTSSHSKTFTTSLQCDSRQSKVKLVFITLLKYIEIWHESMEKS